MPNVFTLTLSSGIGLQGTASGYTSPIKLSVNAGIALQPTLTAIHLGTIKLSVSAGLNLQGAPTAIDNRLIPLSVSVGLGLQGVPSLTKKSIFTLSVQAGLGIQGTTALAKQSIYNLSVNAGLNLTQQLTLTAGQVHVVQVGAGLGLQGTLKLNLIKLLSLSAGIGISATVSNFATHVLVVSSGIGLSAVTSQTRVLILSVSASMGLAGASIPQSLIHVFSVSVGLGLHGAVTATTGTTVVSAGVNFQALVTCQIVVAPGIGVPGLAPIGGPNQLLMTGLSGAYPFTFAETPSGVVLMANGVDPMIRWDGLSAQAQFAGVVAPVSAPSLTASGLGVITGLRYAFARFIDNHGNPSNLSPISQGVQCGRDQSIDDIALNGIGAVTIMSRSHGLTTGTPLLLAGIQGLPINGPQRITVVDQDHFSLQGVVTSGSWLGGGSWTAGASQVIYSLLPTTSQGTIVTLQLYRNLEGSLDAVYLDASVPLQGMSTTYTSTLLDEQLASQPGLALRAQDSLPLANRYSSPPSNRPYIINYLGRIFAVGDTIFYAGCVQVTSGQNIIQGIGTFTWTASLVGRQIYVKGASKPYGIASVNSQSQVLTLTSSYTDPSAVFATYYIRSAPTERKILQWSEVDNPEAWPPWNALGIPENNDEATGLFVKGTYLYVTEQRHVWRFQFSDDPATSGHVFLALDQRGCINQRCIAQADDKVFLLDESGVYSFDGGSEIDPISDPIQVVFYADGLTYAPQVDWTADRTLWHAALDPTRTVIRWFVSFLNQPGKDLTQCLCYNYRLKRWWFEQYPVAISSSCTATLAESKNAAISSGSRRSMVGAECRTVLVLGQSALDLVINAGTLRGSVTTSTTVSLTDALAAFAPNLQGTPVYLVSGTGAGQSSLISSNTSTTLTIVTPWTTPPDTTTTYQIGGIPWSWRSGWLDVEDEEGDTNRDLIVGFQPLQSDTTMSMQLFYDHSLTPEMWAFPYDKDGVTASTGQPDIWVDMASADVLPGYRIFRQAYHTERYAYDDRYVQIYLSGVTNNQVVRIYQVSIRGVDQEGL